MLGKVKNDTGCLSVMACDERRLSDRIFDSHPRRVEDPNLVRLRQTFDQLSPAVSWEDMRARILAALSDLPDEPRPCPPLVRHLPAPAHIGRREGLVLEGAGIPQKECFQSELPDFARLPAMSFPRLLRLPLHNHKIGWTLAAIALVIMAVSLLYPPHRRTFSPHVSPAAPASGAEATPPQARAAQPRVLPPAARAPATITSVRTEFENASAAVVIALTQPVLYEVHRLTRPERVYIDFHNTRLLPQLKGGSVGEGKSCLSKYRLGSPAPQTVRIAFEISIGCSYSARLTVAPSTNLVLLLRPIPPTSGAVTAD